MLIEFEGNIGYVMKMFCYWCIVLYVIYGIFINDKICGLFFVLKLVKEYMLMRSLIR